MGRLDDTLEAGAWSPNNTAGTDLVKVGENQYDNGGVGDGNLTKITQYPGLGAAPRVTQTWYDWRNRAVAVKSGVAASESEDVNRPLLYLEYDNLGQTVVTERYDGDGVSITDANGDGVPERPSASLLRGKSTASFDDLGRVFRTTVFSVDPVTGAVSSNALVCDTWYDQRGQMVKAAAPGGSVTKYRYDGAGRLTASFATDGSGDASWADALSVNDDVVLTQTEFDYDANGNVLLTTRRQRFHDRERADHPVGLRRLPGRRQRAQLQRPRRPDPLARPGDGQRQQFRAGDGDGQRPGPDADGDRSQRQRA